MHVEGSCTEESYDLVIEMSDGRMFTLESHLTIGPPRSLETSHIYKNDFAKLSEVTPDLRPIDTRNFKTDIFGDLFSNYGESVPLVLIAAIFYKKKEYRDKIPKSLYI
jgi:hypothetical protein